jgi:raffinose/stachyose/melibiose transport system permease protein
MSAVTSGAPFPRARSGKRGDRPQKWGNPGVYFIALLFIAVSLAPVVYIVLGGFRTNSQITVSPAGLPNPWVFSNYVGVLKTVTFWGEFANSTIVAIASTLGIVLLGLMVSYVIARYDFKLKGAMYSLFAAGLMFPLVVAITPVYIIVKDLGLVDNLMGIVVPQIAFGLPTTVIILVPFLRAIPKEIEEAAAIDGMGRPGFFFRMAIRLALPGVITVAILAFITSWNNYILPLYVLNTQANYTLPLGVQQFSSQYSQDTARVLAFTSLSMLPALAFFAVFQRRIVGGLTGAVKG